MNKSSLTKSHLNNDFCYELFLLFLWGKSILVGYARALWTHLPEVWGLADFMVSLVFCTLLFFSLRTFMQRLWARDILFFCFSLLIYVAYYWIFPLNQSYYKMYAPTFAEKALPMFLIGASIIPQKSHRLFQEMYWVSICTILAFTFYRIILNPMASGAQADGDMYAAYLFLPHLCVVMGNAMKKPNPLNISIAALGSFVLVSLGTRGTVVCLLAFIVLMLMLFQKNKHPILIASLFVVIAVLLVFGGLLDWLYDFAESNGLSLRVLDKLKSGNFSQSSGRAVIAERVLEYIFLYPLTGLGIYSDRRVAGGQYAHNIVLELMIDFGVIAGLILFICLVVLIAKATFVARRYENNDGAVIILLAYICSGFLKVFLSGSYLNEDTLFFLIGYCVAILREKKLEVWTSRNIRALERRD